MKLRLEGRMQQAEMSAELSRKKFTSRTKLDTVGESKMLEELEACEDQLATVRSDKIRYSVPFIPPLTKSKDSSPVKKRGFAITHPKLGLVFESFAKASRWVDSMESAAHDSRRRLTEAKSITEFYKSKLEQKNLVLVCEMESRANFTSQISELKKELSQINKDKNGEIKQLMKAVEKEKMKSQRSGKIAETLLHQKTGIEDRLEKIMSENEKMSNKILGAEDKKEAETIALKKTVEQCEEHLGAQGLEVKRLTDEQYTILKELDVEKETAQECKAISEKRQEELARERQSITLLKLKLVAAENVLESEKQITKKCKTSLEMLEEDLVAERLTVTRLTDEVGTIQKYLESEKQLSQDHKASSEKFQEALRLETERLTGEVTTMKTALESEKQTSQHHNMRSNTFKYELSTEIAKGLRLTDKLTTTADTLESERQTLQQYEEYLMAEKNEVTRLTEQVKLVMKRMSTLESEREEKQQTYTDILQHKMEESEEQQMELTSEKLKVLRLTEEVTSLAKQVESEKFTVKQLKEDVSNLSKQLKRQTQKLSKHYEEFTAERLRVLHLTEETSHLEQNVNNQKEQLQQHKSTLETCNTEITKANLKIIRLQKEVLNSSKESEFAEVSAAAEASAAVEAPTVAESPSETPTATEALTDAEEPTAAEVPADRVHAVSQSDVDNVPKGLVQRLTEKVANLVKELELEQCAVVDQDVILQALQGQQNSNIKLYEELSVERKKCADLTRCFKRSLALAAGYVAPPAAAGT